MNCGAGIKTCYATTAVLLATGLAGCGFHLQGASPLPQGIDTMYVSYHSNYSVGEPPLVTTLKERLRRQNLLGGVNAPAQLNIQGVRNSTRTVAVSPIKGDKVERELTSRAVFNYSINGARKLAHVAVATSREYSVSETQRLSSTGERQRLIHEMQQDLANQIFMRIALLQNNPGDRASKKDNHG
jgi:LPS-assembly lipoprotein